MEIWFTLGVTTQLRMLNLAKYLILSSLLSEVRVALHLSFSYLFWIMITINTLFTWVFDFDLKRALIDLMHISIDLMSALIDLLHASIESM